MRNLRTLSLVALSVVGVLALTAFAVPPVQDMVLEQVRRPDGIHFGSKTVDILADGNLYVTSPDGGFNVGAGGAVTLPGTLTLKSATTCGAAAACGSIALTSASPSTATVTVPAGVSCSCWPVGDTAAIAAGGCAAKVVTTTLTLTGPNTVTTTMRYMCFL